MIAHLLNLLFSNRDYIGYNGPLFEDLEKKNYNLSKDFPGNSTGTSIPKEVLESWSKYKPQSTYQKCFENSNLSHDMSVADVYLAMLFAWHPDSEEFPRCAALAHRVAAHPVIAPTWQRNFDHRLAVKWGR